ncbi:class II aaRS and biotin synthetase [Aulographum hederae CBS 113979]|uniref:Class II aaRS and biotin synthetase n=1 Tax=Aulographum hederae CBS 113979 TaxID=1176131 RepID=A0A6G1GX35_9PEZI|nr:class II aaRS and biotin synthetase [Aulographum hederae CBS 113979]
MSKPYLPFLRPYLSQLRPRRAEVYARFFSVTRPHPKKSANKASDDGPSKQPLDFWILQLKTMSSSEAMRKLRHAALTAADPNASLYPRLSGGHGARVMTLASFVDLSLKKYKEEHWSQITRTVCAKIRNIRFAGSKLAFFDLWDGTNIILQLTVNFMKIAEGRVAREEPVLGSAQFKQRMRAFQKGDWISVTGTPSRQSSGENIIGMVATVMPDLLAPTLHTVPKEIKDMQTLSRNRHVQLILDSDARKFLRSRAWVEQGLRNYFYDHGFLQVNTPILGSNASGASARSFETAANNVSDRNLHLRIAPELYLKRLIVGGMGPVYEIGPAFRNEGIDSTHNPEFTICEFYLPFASLPDLMERTEDLYERLNSMFPKSKTLPRPFKRMSFIPALETAIGKPLPDVASLSAMTELLEICASHDVTVSAQPTLPDVLDTLCSHFLEPLCQEPTWIIHHPAIMSPLSKSFKDKESGQLVSARAELFAKGQEHVNCYEEENDPAEQRRKFVEQNKIQAEAQGTEPKAIDESYIEALEWGLPPTGGWGCGVDRLVMFFSGAERIADVLPFGTLKNVIAMDKEWGRF